MIKRFSEMTYEAKNSGSTKVRKAKILLASVKNIASELEKTNSVVDKVFNSFSDDKKQFSRSQVKRSILAFSKMDQSLLNMFKNSYSNLKLAVSKELPTERISSQIEDLSALRAKLAILRAQAAASVGLEGLDEAMVEIDEAGYEVGPEELDNTNSEELSDEEKKEKGIPLKEDPEPGIQAEENIPKEVVLEEEEVVPEEEDNIVEELPAIEMDNGEMDNMIGDEILGEEMGNVEEEKEDEISVSASLKQKKMTSSKVQSGKNFIDGEDSILKSLMEELSF
jgi:hypothetical protein